MMTICYLKAVSFSIGYWVNSIDDLKIFPVETVKILLVRISYTTVLIKFYRLLGRIL